MYTLIRTMTLRSLLTEQLSTLISSLVIVEVFYKFHSFLLEASAFLATWFILDYALHWLLRRQQPEKEQPAIGS